MATKVISHIQFLKIHSNFFSKSRNAFKILNLNLKTSLCCSADLSSSTSSSEQISHKKDVELISGQLAAEFSVSGSSLQQLTEEADVAKEKHSFPTKYIGIELPVAHDSRVKSAAFFKSSVDVTQCPTDGRPEIAVIGRSNVGKSSLINMLVNRKELALTSKKPGKTRLINHFLINDKWYLVDLPGYGYAKAAQSRRLEWSDFTKKYFMKRETLVSVLLLIDASIPPQPIDLAAASWFGQAEIPMTIVFTKCDKRKKVKNGGKPPHVHVKAFEEALLEFFNEIPCWIMTSSATGMGNEDLLMHMAQLRKYWKS